eukprot:13212057-Alexandrium_andersonii.AAC.1
MALGGGAAFAAGSAPILAERVPLLPGVVRAPSHMVSERPTCLVSLGRSVARSPRGCSRCSRGRGGPGPCPSPGLLPGH